MKNLYLLLLVLLIPVCLQGQTVTKALPADEIVATSNATAGSDRTPRNGTSERPGVPHNEKTKPFSITRFSSSPSVDGKLDEDVWKSAVRLEAFVQTQPGDGIKASKESIALFGYDEKYLYIGLRAYDEPGGIRATVAQRDGVFGEDNFRVYLDTYDDKRRAYVLGFNPLGIQQDGIYSESSGIDFNVDILMESKGVILADGWSVEVKVPFKSLRYVAGKGKFWGIHVWRNIDRLNDEMNSWMPINRNISGLLSQAGKLTGLDDIKAERTFEMVPTMTFKQTGRRLSPDKFSNPPVQADFGFTAKYSISSNITLDAAYNPDFADVEADAPVVEANQRFPIFFEEKRPFFLEGVEIFKTPIFAVNTRQIQNPDVALKLTGKVGKNSFGVMAAVDDPISGNPNNEKAYVGIVRFKRDFGKESHYGFLATSYDFPGKRNQLGGFDVRWRINDSTTFDAQVLGTTSRNYFYDPTADETKYRTGNALIYNYEINSRKKEGGWGFGGVGRTRDYRADLGFTRRTNTNSVYGYRYFSKDGKPDSYMIRRNINLNFGFDHDFQGRFQGVNSNINGNVRLKGNIALGAGAYIGAEKLIEEEFGPKRMPVRQGAFSGDPERSVYQTGGWVWAEKRFGKRLFAYANFQIDLNSYDFDFGGGPKFPRVSPAALLNPNAPMDPGAGRQLNLVAGFEAKPTDKLNLNFRVNKVRLTRNDTGLVAFDSNILQLRSTYQFSRFISIKTRLDYNTLSSRLFGQYTFGWTPSPGKALYVGYNDRWSNSGYEFSPRVQGMTQLDRTFFIKFSYLFRKSF